MSDLLDLLLLVWRAGLAVAGACLAVAAALVLCWTWVAVSGRILQAWRNWRETRAMRHLIAERDAELIVTISPERLAAGADRVLAVIRTLDRGLPDDATADDIAALFDAPPHVKGDAQ